MYLCVCVCVCVRAHTHTRNAHAFMHTCTHVYTYLSTHARRVLKQTTQLPDESTQTDSLSLVIPRASAVAPPHKKGHQRQKQYKQWEQKQGKQKNLHECSAEI